MTDQAAIKPMLSMIVAMSNNRVIGVDNQLPWRIPEDLKHFKAKTLGKPVIMGRKTYESIGRPLPGRLNLVVTRNSNWSAEGVQVYLSPELAVDAALKHAAEQRLDEVMIIGGAQLYQDLLPVVNKLYVTHVDVTIDGDAFFPEIDASIWFEVDQSALRSDDTGKYAYRFVEYVKKVFAH